jgi:membrane protein implicated in regulation of membrane protease activity
MVPVFLTTLVIGLGMLAIQLFAGHDADGGHDAGHDADGHDGPWILLASVRFWAFALLTFGLVGTLLRLFHFAGRIEATVIATVVALLAGYVASATVRRLQRQVTTSVITNEDVVGRVGRVLVVPTGEARGKVRVAVRGSVVDYVARSDDTLEADESVIVEACDEGEVRVIRAPKELALKE